jgi:hypothetical protein
VRIRQLANHVVGKTEVDQSWEPGNGGVGGCARVLFKFVAFGGNLKI